MVLSIVIRMELYNSGIQVYTKIFKCLCRNTDFVDKTKHLYNTSMTAHGLIMKC